MGKALLLAFLPVDALKLRDSAGRGGVSSDQERLKKSAKGGRRLIKSARSLEWVPTFFKLKEQRPWIWLVGGERNAGGGKVGRNREDTVHDHKSSGVNGKGVST